MTLKCNVKFCVILFSEHCIQKSQEKDFSDFLGDKRQAIMIIVIIVISLIAIAIIGGLVFLVCELMSKRKDQDGSKYKLIPKSDDEDADDEFDLPIKNGIHKSPPKI